MTDLSLQALVDTGIFDCENTALEGRTFWIYSFRDEDPGGNDVTLKLPGFFVIHHAQVDGETKFGLRVTSCGLRVAGCAFRVISYVL